MTIRAATSADDAFILGLVERFSEFPLPPGRDRQSVTAALRRDLELHLHERPITSHFFVIVQDGELAGFMHLQLVDDFFDAGLLCHISDLAVSPAHEGHGLGQRLLVHSEAFAREHGGVRLTLGVFPGNERARRLYARYGFEPDMLRLGKPL
ncbi:MAG TPA: GNAT family N-acetyltransferase [Lysobacter sp.]